MLSRAETSTIPFLVKITLLKIMKEHVLQNTKNQDIVYNDTQSLCTKVSIIPLGIIFLGKYMM